MKTIFWLYLTTYVLLDNGDQQIWALHFLLLGALALGSLLKMVNPSTVYEWFRVRLESTFGCLPKG